LFTGLVALFFQDTLAGELLDASTNTVQPTEFTHELLAFRAVVAKGQQRATGGCRDSHAVAILLISMIAKGTLLDYSGL
jgi:hypothetical protein